MNYESFISDIKTRIGACVGPEVQLLIQPMPRNNGTSYDGLILLQPGLNISPTIYLTPYYHRYLDGMSMEDICSDIFSTYQKQQPKENFDIGLFTDFARVKSRIIMRLVNYPRNEQMLADVPFFRFYDLAVIFYCLLYAGDDNQASILVHNEHLELWGINQDTLYRLARENTPALLPQQVTPMCSLMEHFAAEIGLMRELHPADDGIGSSNTDIPMYVISNSYRTNGACAILYDQLLHELAEQLQSNLILLPSSIHEFILLAAEDSSDLQDFSQMVREVNETQLADDEVLADHAYYYNRKTRLISM